MVADGPTLDYYKQPVIEAIHGFDGNRQSANLRGKLIDLSLLWLKWKDVNGKVRLKPTSVGFKVRAPVNRPGLLPFIGTPTL